MKYLKRFFKWLAFLIVVVVITLYVTDYDYILKGVRVVYMTGHTTAFIDDHTYFENEPIPASTNPQPWVLHKNYNKVKATKELTETNQEFGTVAFLVIKNDSIWFEDYEEGYGINSQTNSFSMAKSITSALLGKAIKDGYIKNLDQPISDFFEQYKGETTTVGDLSSMASGLDWDESYKSPFSVTARAYYDDDLTETILNQKVIEPSGQYFKYLSGSTQLLGLVIEKASGKDLEKYASDSFWEPMGFEKDALWQIDDDENRLVKSYCCIASNARDFARFGKLYKNYGSWKGKQLIDSTFVTKSITPRFKDSPEYGYGFWLINYRGKDVFAMRGILGQYVITIPDDDLIIVRLGHNRSDKKRDAFSYDFYVFVDEVYKMLDL